MMAKPVQMHCQIAQVRNFAHSAFQDNRFGDAARAKGGSPRILTTGM